MNDAAWDEFCRGSINGTIFHTRNFLGYHRPGRWDWDHFEIPGPGGSVRALWPAARADDGATWWSGAGASMGGPVFPEGTTGELAREAVTCLVEEAPRRGYRSLLVTPPPPLYEAGERGITRQALLDNGFRIRRAEVSQAAPLEGGEALALLSGPARRGAAKAQRDGVVVGHSDAYEEFHELLVEDRKRIGAAPVHSASELRDLAGRLRDHQHLLVARFDGEMIAGSWALQTDARVALSFYVCQSREHRRLRATNVLLLRAMEWAVGRGLRYYDFGLSSVEEVTNEGLFAFKASHGGQPFARETFARDVG